MRSRSLPVIYADAGSLPFSLDIPRREHVKAESGMPPPGEYGTMFVCLQEIHSGVRLRAYPR